MKPGTKRVLKYILLPQVLPRLRELFSAGFGYISFFMAQIYGGVRLLPAWHPYLNPANMGKFGVRHVVAQAASNLRFRRENADQVAVFFLLLVGIGIIAVQVVLLGFAVFAGSAFAGTGGGIPMPTNFAGFFLSPNAKNDVAYILLDRIFGVPGIFVDNGGGATCVAANQNLSCFNFPGAGLADVNNVYAAAEGQWPTPFHLALHSLFQFYSTGLLVVAGLIFVYYVITVAVETAETGTPFGRRFNHVWTPLRMVAALGLLIPINNGLNSAQYIVLYAAKYGSGFATNGWNKFLDVATAGTNTPAGDRNRLVATPQAPDPTSLLEYATVLQTCWWAENIVNERRVCGWMVRSGANNPPRALLTPNTTYEEALQFYGNKDVMVVFGDYRIKDTGAGSAGGPLPYLSGTSSDKQNNCTSGSLTGKEVFSNYSGSIYPACGEVVLVTTSAADATGPADAGAYYAQEAYFELLKELWFGTTACGPAGTIENWGIGLAQRYAGFVSQGSGLPIPQMMQDPKAPIPAADDMNCLVNLIKTRITGIVNQAVTAELQQGNWAVGNIRDLGWGGASVWYNKIAQINGALIAATQALPYVRKYPSTMEEVKKKKVQQDRTVVGRNRFEPTMSSGIPVTLEGKKDADMQVATALWKSYDMWKNAYPKTTASPEVIKSMIVSIFGLDGLYSILKNPTTHPLAQLVAIGRSLVESSIRNLGLFAVSTGAELASSVAGFSGLASGIGMFSSFMFQIAMIGLGAGFVLFYVIPFLPFIYFFFAVGGWVKGIFEAMVGVPLWALAHIRIDGQGFAGDHAIGGYHLILEVFLRPILIVFGMLGSIIIFAGQVFLLHEIFPLVTSNIGGFDMASATGAPPSGVGGFDFRRDVIDQFFYTVTYAIIVYMIGMASFKLIDQVPNHILRWMGVSISTFQENSGDVAQNLVRNVAIGENVAQTAISNAVQGGKQTIGQAAKGLHEVMTGKPTPGR